MDREGHCQTLEHFGAMKKKKELKTMGMSGNPRRSTKSRVEVL